MVAMVMVMVRSVQPSRTKLTVIGIKGNNRITHGTHSKNIFDVEKGGKDAEIMEFID